MKIECPFCKKELGNADYRATLHTNGYHDMRQTIYELITKYKYIEDEMNEISVVAVLESLLEK